MSLNLASLSLQAQGRPTIEIDENPGESGRLFVDKDYGPIHVTGCIDEPGNCLATIVIQG